MTTLAYPCPTQRDLRISDLEALQSLYPNQTIEMYYKGIKIGVFDTASKPVALSFYAFSETILQLKGLS